MELKINFKGTMMIDVDIDALMDSVDLADMVEEYIKENMYEVMNSIITVTEIDSKEE